tara:strand:- start:356 stop:628 length:273 start_codon:yes stop_codon:yes gene_type:complete
MAYGIQVDGLNLTYSALSVVAKGSLTSATTINLTKSTYNDITEFTVVFIPIGIRDTSLEELRPTSSQTSTTITITQPSNGTNHQYLVLGR